MTLLGDIVLVQKGKKPPSTSREPSQGMLPLILTPNLKGARLETFTESFSGQVTCTFNDVLLTWDGSVGTTYCGLEGVVGSTLAKLTVRPGVDVNPRYVWHYLRFREKDIQKNARGASIPHVDPTFLLALDLPEIPRNEQNFHVECLDTLDVRISEHELMLEKLRELEEKLFHDLQTLGTWPKRTLGELGTVTTGRTPPTSKSGMFDGTIPFLTPGDLNSGKPAVRTLTDAGAQNSRVVRGGSTMVCCIGATIGKTDIAASMSAFNQQINAVEWGETVTDLYGLYALRSAKNLIIGSGSSTTLPLLPKSRFANLEIPVPPLAEQQDFDEKILQIADLRSLVLKSTDADYELREALRKSIFGGA